jgi:hypothetical protein
MIAGFRPAVNSGEFFALHHQLELSGFDPEQRSCILVGEQVPDLASPRGFVA